MCHIWFFIIYIYLEPKLKRTGLTGIFVLTSARFGSAFKLLIHRIQSFAIDVSGVPAFWQIKSSKNPHFEWKSRMCQAWCSMLFFLLLLFCLLVLSVTPCMSLLVSCRWLLRTVVFWVNMLLKDVQFSYTPYISQKVRSVAPLRYSSV